MMICSVVTNIPTRMKRKKFPKKHLTMKHEEHKCKTCTISSLYLLGEEKIEGAHDKGESKMEIYFFTIWICLVSESWT